PSDGRATLVQLEPLGRQYFQDMQVVKHALDTALTNMMGEERMTHLVASLQDLIDYTNQYDPTWEQNISSR
ncbi:MAG TPA: hypothetical protein VHL11_06510, partial [Phototrophicaceae bacterium]|nr:hypothetical protein [Phototrophicaceae bacterium]